MDENKVETSVEIGLFLLSSSEETGYPCFYRTPQKSPFPHITYLYINKYIFKAAFKNQVI